MAVGCFSLRGGEWLRFSDAITAVASLAVIDILLYSVLMFVLIPVNSQWGADAAGIVSVLVASLIIGYVFAGKIQEESRIRAIGKVAVLSTVLLTIYTMAFFTNPYSAAVIKENLEDMFSTSGWTNMDWLAYSQMLMVMMMALNAVLALVFSFVGIYVGSMRKASAKT